MSPETPRDVIVVGASAGGVVALRQFVGALPKELNAVVGVVLHLSPDHESLLPSLLTRAGSLPAVHPKDGQQVTPGKILVAPPDHQIFFQDDRIRVLRGPRENLHRPSIDVLFRSAAIVYGPRVTGVLLTGGDSDGVAGLRLIQERGGVVVVQDPADSAFDTMPLGALAALQPDFVLPLAEIGRAVSELVRGYSIPMGSHVMADEAEGPVGGQSRSTESEIPGVPSVYSCPECGGVLWESPEGEWTRFRCRVGHAFSEEGMTSAQSEAAEGALWAAMRALEENASMLRRIAQKSDILRTSLTKKAEERERQAGAIRSLLLKEAT